MQHGKRVSSYLNKQRLVRLDTLRGQTPRSYALNKIIDYILSQEDAWVQALICVPQDDLG